MQLRRSIRSLEARSLICEHRYQRFSLQISTQDNHTERNGGNGIDSGLLPRRNQESLSVLHPIISRHVPLFKHCWSSLSLSLPLSLTLSLRWKERIRSNFSNHSYNFTHLTRTRQMHLSQEASSSSSFLASFWKDLEESRKEANGGTKWILGFSHYYSWISKWRGSKFNISQTNYFSLSSAMKNSWYFHFLTVRTRNSIIVRSWKMKDEIDPMKLDFTRDWGSREGFEMI